ncbi:hypothetical protein Cpir12675_005173 [Ceratocystis pirilliformis]|uniref:Uncharacterized protein n=1 Tax=Ceratocystis pirilliformis TaxID=259994 RepID=A0ABR3YSZ9_9PEZI
MLNIYAANFVPTKTASAPSSSSIPPSPELTPESSMHFDPCGGATGMRVLSAPIKTMYPLTPTSTKDIGLMVNQHSTASIQQRSVASDTTPVTPVHSHRRRNRRTSSARVRK